MRLALIVGARPQFVKAAPVLRALERAGAARPVLIHSGQHADAAMSAVFFSELGLPQPDHELTTPAGPQGEMTGRMLAGIEACLMRDRVDAAMVFGDTNTTLAGALAAVKLGVPCAHVEAGLRSGNRAMPEEINRVLADHCCRWLLCPTAHAVRNLAREGITEGIALVGDVMLDAVRMFGAEAARRLDRLTRLGLTPGRYAVLTLHRAGNTADADALRRVLSACAGLPLPVLFPVHPRTRRLLDAGLAAPPAVRLVEPLGYLDMLCAVMNARVVLTDSGGLQKEAFFLRVPCVTLREETEWGETLRVGANELAGTDPVRIAAAVQRAMVSAPVEAGLEEFGDGRAGDAICRAVLGA